MEMNFYRHFRQSESQINLWVAPVRVYIETFLVSYFDILSDKEKQRYYRLRLESDRQQYFISHVLLRMILSHTAGWEVEPYRWQFTENMNGKPMIDETANLPCLHFNLSHCERLVVVAISTICSVGADVEPLKKTADIDIMEVVLSPGEYAWLKTRPPAMKRVDFIRLWTVKEAYAKMLGLGSSLDFASFEIAMDPVRIVRTETGKPHPNDLYLENRDIQMEDGKYYVSLAARHPLVEELRVTVHCLDLPLIKSLCDNSQCITQESAAKTNNTGI